MLENWAPGWAGLREAALMVIRTCQYPWRRSADKIQIVSIADERSAEDARGVTLDLPLLNKSHLPSSSRLPQAKKAGCLSHPLLPLSPFAPQPVTPLLP